MLVQHAGDYCYRKRGQISSKGYTQYEKQKGTPLELFSPGDGYWSIVQLLLKQQERKSTLVGTILYKQQSFKDL